MSHERLVFSILEFVHSECLSTSRSDDDRETLEVVKECLESVYHVHLGNPSDVEKYHIDKPLTQIFNSATLMSQTKSIPTDDDKEKAEQLKTEGNNLMKDGKIEEAIKCYDRAIKLDNTSAVYLCNRAAACSKLGRHEEAIQNCNDALELDPKYGKAYGRMGTAYMALEKYEKAKKNFAMAKELDPDNELYTVNLKTLQDKTKETNDAQPGSFMNSLFSNPGIMNMASQFMANPQMQQMMTNMMSGFGGMTGADSSSSGQQPSNFSTATTAGSESQQSNPATVPNNSSNAETNTNSSNDATSGGFSNIFQFATQMAQQLEQSNPGLVNNLRQTMQNIGGGNTSGNENTDNTREEGKE
ncbi:small glutamine-rich tetratricopeptide repeat-containing protein beta-like [Xenia sp. Carnegie-2017]|uniref:small glutamine-rich tetratricopeptide repeat-containing protein beta-like n=1 Tax=Xenia sp. Carnegie-2017 TaxID=2897299 RepID=UPI001F039DBE|nr:small glutamine-rich tetratricopeptide repeat-containing protein beta-like [Xenia sp. Carnegie-2017]